MKTKIALIGKLILICFIFNILFQIQNNVIEKSRSYIDKRKTLSSMNSAETISIMLGGFRGIMVDILWLKAIELNQKNEFYELLPVYKAIITLQPHFTMVWFYAATNLALDVSYEAETLEEKWQWIKEGIKLLKEGTIKNPDNFYLHYYLGYIYVSKCAEHTFYMDMLNKESKDNFLEAAKHFNKAARLAKGKVSVGLLAQIQRQTAHAYWRLAEKKRESGQPGEKIYCLKAFKIVENIFRKYPLDGPTKKTYYYFKNYLNKKGWLDAK
jgi:tetratricopeptide (TPR) repeat protein